MGSPFITVQYNTTRGIDQSRQRHLVNPAFAWKLLNMRARRGRLEQTPLLVEQVSSVAAVNGEATPVNVKHVRRVSWVSNAPGMNPTYMMLSTNTCRLYDITGTGTSIYIPCVAQTAKPNNATLTGECLLYGHNSTDFATDGDTIDVNIHTDGSHFRWRRNGGAWSADLVIAAEVTIGANGLKVSFQGQGATTDYTNFTVGDTWTWTRQAALPASTSGVFQAYDVVQSEAYSGDLYLAQQRTIMRLRLKALVATAQGFITTVGYTKVYGNHVTVFQNHLFVAQYAAGAVTSCADSYDPTVTPYTIAWSHLNNPDQFFSTLINEADQFTIPELPYADVQGVGITSMEAWRDLLYVFTPDSISTVQYIGLPNVMTVRTLNTHVGCISYGGVIRTPKGLYFVGRDNFYVIRDYEPVVIGDSIRQLFLADVSANGGLTNLVELLNASYNSFTGDVTWSYRGTLADTGKTQQREYVYNEITDDWHIRNVPLYTCTSAQITPQEARLYGTSGKIYIDRSGTGTPVYDLVVIGSNYSAYTSPTVETPFMPTEDAFHMKEQSGLYVDAAYSANGSGVEVSTMESDIIGDASTAYAVCAETWTPSLVNDRLSLPRSAYRQIALKFRFLATGSSYVTNAIFNGFQMFFQGPERKVEK